MRFGAVMAALALVATGCSSERSKDDAGDTGKDSGGDTTTEAASFGDLPSPCGPGDASGATDQGVTDKQIVIGYGDDRGYAAAPGLNQELGDAVTAMIAWCNEQGGINGREVVGKQYDAALTNAATVMQKACKETFMLVGEGFAYDEAAEQFRVGCDLPAVAGFIVGPNASMGPNAFSAVPLPVDYFNGQPMALAAETFPAFKDNMDFLGSNSPAVAASRIRADAAFEKIGITPKDCGVSLNSEGDASYVPFAEKFKKCGIEALWSSNSPNASQFGMLEANKRIGLDLQYVYEATWYNPIVTDYNKKSGAADGMASAIVFQPFENADVVPAVQDYLDAVDASGGKTGLLGMQATSAFLLWATAAKECGDDLTRDCVVEQLSGVHDWTAGGLHAPTDPGGNKPTDCALLVQLEGDTWTQIAPEEQGEFSCNPDMVLEIDPKLSGVTLDDNRHSTAFQ